MRVADGEGRGRKGDRRASQRRIEPYAWLGAGAVTLGLGAAIASGTGVAHADSTASASGSSSSSHASKPASSTGAHSGRSSKPLQSSATTTSAADQHSAGATAPPKQPSTVVTARRSTASPGIRTTVTASPRIPVAALTTPAAAANSLLGLLAGVLSAFGLNTPTAPANPLGGLVWGALRSVENRYGLVPVTGTPTVGTPNLTTGVVTGTVEFTEPAGQPLTYAVSTNPALGIVTVTAAGAFTYTPTTAARLATADTFTVTASDGVAATNEVVTVPVIGTATPGVTTDPGHTGLVINLIWDSSVASAPPSFKPTVQRAAQMIEATVTNNITLNIAVGYGEIGGTPIGSGTSEGEALGSQQESYAVVKQQLSTCDTTPIGQSVVAHLPASNPFGSLTYDVSAAQLKVFGVVPANGAELDGDVGFSTDWPSADLLAAALHELTHAMGRNSGWGSVADGQDVTPLDLTRYSSPGVLVCNGAVATSAHLQYFSVDGGTTVLADYSDTSDYGDWATNSLTVTDPFNAYVDANSNSLTSVDIAVLDAIGYTT